MNNPQTLAINIKENTEMIGKYGCCAFTAMWIAGIEPEDGEAIQIVSDAMKNHLLGPDCTVLWKPFLYSLTGREVSVQFMTIKSLNETASIKGRIAVKFEHNGKSHWVGVENGKVKFNSLERSVCVSEGKPTECRIINFF